jgi:hypothetical protein
VGVDLGRAFPVPQPQAGIDYAAVGDTVLVQPGIYTVSWTGGRVLERFRAYVPPLRIYGPWQRVISDLGVACVPASYRAQGEPTLVTGKIRYYDQTSKLYIQEFMDPIAIETCDCILRSPSGGVVTRTISFCGTNCRKGGSLCDA